MLALCLHCGDLVPAGRRQVGEVGMPLGEQLPGASSFGEVGHFLGEAAGVNRLDLALRARLVADRDGDPVVLADVLEFLAGSIDQEVEPEAVVRITDDRGLRPAVRTDRSERHDPVRVEDGDCWLFHLNFP